MGGPGSSWKGSLNLTLKLDRIKYEVKISNFRLEIQVKVEPSILPPV